MDPDHYEYNPYASPAHWGHAREPEPPRFRPLAVVVGWLADIGSTAVASVIVGMVVGAVLVGKGIPPERLEAELSDKVWLQALGVLLGTCGTVFGGYVGAWMGKDFPLRHALAVGIVGVLTGLVVLALLPDIQPMWVSVVGLVVTVPAAVLGGYLRAARVATIASRTPLPPQ